MSIKYHQHHYKTTLQYAINKCVSKIRFTGNTSKCTKTSYTNKKNCSAICVHNTSINYDSHSSQALQQILPLSSCSTQSNNIESKLVSLVAIYAT